LLAVTL